MEQAKRQMLSFLPITGDAMALVMFQRVGTCQVGWLGRREESEVAAALATKGGGSLAWAVPEGRG